MKNLFFALVALFVVTIAKGQTELSKLPMEAQVFVKKHFPSTTVSLVKKEIDRSYNAFLANGDIVEFDKNGQWEEVKCKSGMVPSAVIPMQIREKVAELYPGAYIIEIDRDKREYNVKLSNGIDIEFNHKFNVTDVDD